MITIKHFMAPSSPADGPRIWVEPTDLTLDLRAWCDVHVLATDLGPPVVLAEWYDEQPGSGRFEFFRRAYRAWLLEGPHLPVLRTIAGLAADRSITLLHQCTDGEHNTASVLRDVLEEVAACSM